MSAHNGKFLAECIGKSILILSKLVGAFLLIKAIAPNGLIH